MSGTDLCIAAGAVLAGAAAIDEGDGDTIADFEFCDAGANGGDDAGEFVAGDVWQYDIAVVAHPGVPIAAAEAGSFDFDDDAVGGCGWGRDVFNREIASEFGEIDGAHALSVEEGIPQLGDIQQRLDRPVLPRHSLCR